MNFNVLGFFLINCILELFGNFSFRTTSTEKLQNTQYFVRLVRQLTELSNKSILLTVYGVRRGKKKAGG